jgi:hypothetical protein
MTEGKEKPPFRLFEEVMKAETEKLGYYHDGMVYVRSDMVDHHQTILEEFAHYVTGSTDLSRDFQDFAFRLATKLALLLEV